MSKSLLRDTIHGLKWSTISKLAQQGLQYIATIILVGVLSPDDFGLMAIAMIVIGFLDIFKDLGTASAIIKEYNPSNNLKCSLFWVNVLFGLLISLTVYFSAYIVSAVFNYERIVSVLQVLSVSFIFAGISIQQKTLLEKELFFKRLSLIELFSSAIAFTVAVILALKGYGVWSLVWQFIINTSSNTLLIWIFSNWKPKFIFNFNEVKKITSYSSNLVGFNLINYLARNGDYFLIGKFLGDRDLGHYYLAYRIMLYPLRNITWVISRVIFPAFSKIQHDNNKLREAYLRLTNTIAIITFPMMAGIAVVSFNFTSAFFGENWDTTLVAYIIIILAPVGALQSVISTVGNIYQVKGRTDWMFRWSIFATAFTLIGFIIGLKWGIIGIASSYLITNVLIIIPVFLIPFKLINLSIIKFLRSFELTIYSVAGMIIILLIALYFVNDLFSNLVTLSITIILGIISYTFLSLLINNKNLIEIKKMISKYFNSSRTD